MEAKAKRLFNLKRYEKKLRKSLESSTNPNQSLSIFVQNPMNYQFKHFQLSNKVVQGKSLSKKASFSHLSTSGMKEASPDFKAQNFFRVSKIQRQNFYEKLNKLKSFHLGTRNLVSSANFTEKRPTFRPKSVSPVTRRQKEFKVDGSVKSANLISIRIVQPAIEITPWSKCMFCASAQNYKINYTLIHGVCTSHSTNLSEFLSCTHCSSIVPFAKYSLISSCDSCLEYRVVSNKDCSHNLCESCEVNCSVCSLLNQNLVETQKPPSMILKESFQSRPANRQCDSCRSSTAASLQPCSHYLCSSCLSVACLACKPSSQPQKTCERCGKIVPVNKQRCGHFLCADCVTKVCILCSSASSDPFRSGIDTERCEYCNEKNAEKLCSKSHHLCQGCFANPCFLCNPVENTEKKVCESCRKELAVKNCAKGHQVCADCHRFCCICNSDTTSIDYRSSSQNYETNKVCCNYCADIIDVTKGENCEHFFCRHCQLDHKKNCIDYAKGPGVSISVDSESSVESAGSNARNDEPPRKEPKKSRKETNQRNEPSQSKKTIESKEKEGQKRNHYEKATISNENTKNPDSSQSSRVVHDQETKKCCLLL